MSDVIRHGTIVVDLVQGKVELKAPDLSPVLNARQKELELINQIEAGQKRLIDLQNQMVRPGGGSSPGGGGGGGGTAPSVPGMPAPATIDATADAQNKLSAAIRESGEGVMRLARGFVLLSGASGESLQKIVQGLAVVQGAYDLFAGSEKLVRNLAAAETALAAAQAATTVATNANTVAIGTNAAANVAMTRGALAAAAAQRVLAVAFNPVTLAIVAVVSAIMTLVEAWDYFTESAEEAREKALAQAEATQILTNAMAGQLAAMRQVADLQRMMMTDQEKSASLAAEAAQGRASAGLEIDLAGGRSPEAQLAARKFASSELGNASAALKQRDQLEQSILDKKLRQADANIQAIKQQENLVQAAQRALDVEKAKADAQQAQIGRLSTLQQNQLKAIRDKLLAGGDITRGEEKRLEDLGGDQGRSIVDARAKKRAEAAGFGPDFFKGIEGASSGLDEAASKFKEAVDALKALIDKNGTVASNEAEKQKLQKEFADFRAALAEEIKATTDLIASNAARIHELEITVAVNAAQQ